MRSEYDFSNAVKNPYINALKEQITVSIDADTVNYFMTQSELLGIPYQTLISLYLKDCADNERLPNIS